MSEPRFCREVQSALPTLLGGEVHGWAERTMRAHLRRCPECSAEQARQEQLGEAIGVLRSTRPVPPEGLLDELLEHVATPGMRARAAVPARGALSGARPGLSVAFLTVGAIASTGAGWAAVKGTQWAVGRVRHRSER